MLDLDKDFDSTMSSSSSSTIDVNGNQIITQENKSSTQTTNEPEREVESYETPKLPDYEDPNQIYEDTNEESHTFKKLNHELDSEQGSVASQARNSEDLSRLISRDYSYEIGDKVPYKGTIYTIDINNDPADAKVTSDTMDRWMNKESSGAIDRYIRDYSDSLDELDPGQDSLDITPDNTEQNLDTFLTGLY